MKASTEGCEFWRILCVPLYTETWPSKPAIRLAGNEAIMDFGNSATKGTPLGITGRMIVTQLRYHLLRNNVVKYLPRVHHRGFEVKG